MTTASMGIASTPPGLETAASSAPFHPVESTSLAETGISESMIDSLIGKYLLGIHSSTGRKIGSVLGLPFSIIDKRLTALKTRRMITSTNVAAMGDFTVELTEEGHRQARLWSEACAYVGTAPVPLDQYIAAVRAQSQRLVKVDRHSVERSFQSISMHNSLMGRVGPAVRSGAGLFLHGAPGNGKTTIAERIGDCYESAIWIPQALLVDSNIIRLYDPAYHQELPTATGLSLLKENSVDQRWVRVRRPTVIAGGELSLDALEIRHDHVTNISEAPLQLKANNGVLVIDDFGRQRIAPADLLNRWIVPLDRKYDLLTLYTGKRFEVPFELLVVFSTNLDPGDLVDEAFLRRIPYKIHVPDPNEDEFRAIFRSVAIKLEVKYDDEAISALIVQHYQGMNRPMRRCHPRDFLAQLIHHCDYTEQARAMTAENLDKVARDYFLHGPAVHLES